MQGPQDSSFAYESFTRVNPRRRRKGQYQGATAPSDLLMRAKEELSTDGDWSLGCREILHAALRDVRMKPLKVLCLGLGSPSSSREARAQLALLTDLCASVDIRPVDVSVYDPVFTDVDRRLFQTLEMRCLDSLQGVKHSLDGPTILYMPHCDLNLYESVVRANWTLEGVCNMVFLANHFRDYVDNNAACKLERVSPCLLRLVPFVESRALPASSTFPSAFNSLSVQYVRRTQLPLENDVFWETQAFLDSGP